MNCKGEALVAILIAVTVALVASSLYFINAQITDAQVLEQPPEPISSPTPSEKIAICHKTASTKNPYEVIESPLSALPSHLKHGDKLFCSTNEQCSGTDSCETVSTNPQIKCCVKCQTSDEICDDELKCCQSQGLLCIKSSSGDPGRCRICADKGDICSNDDDCCSGLICNNGFCGEPCREQGQSCTIIPSVCCKGLICDPETCEPCKKTGEECSGFLPECCVGHCVDGKCKPCKDEGEQCTSDASCCNKICPVVTQVCGPCLADDEPCIQDENCCNGQCTGFACGPCKDLGQPCQNTLQCCPQATFGAVCRNDVCSYPPI